MLEIKRIERRFPLTTNAETAANLYDSLGITALENYLRHTRAAPYSEPPWSRYRTPTIELPDDSMVRLLILPGHQTQTLQFLWQDEQRTFHEILRDVPDSIKPQRTTEPELDSITLVDWPNTESIQMTLLRIACRESGFDGPDLPETAKLAFMDTMVPGCRKAVNDEIRSDRQPNNIIDQLDELQHKYAEGAKARIPTSQWEAFLEDMQEQSPNGPEIHHPPQGAPKPEDQMENE